jgi:hypothetical protein
MIEFNRLVIYGFNKVQLIRDTLPGGIVPADGLTQLSAFANHILSQKPEGFVEAAYYSITVMNSVSVEYVDGEQRSSFLIKMENVDQTLLDLLLTEIVSLINS